MRRVVVVTGANGGIGLALCERLLSQDDQIRLCLACRNMQRAEIARSALQASHPSADVGVLEVDVGSLKSVVQGAKELRERYGRVDYLYLNAGIMPNPRFNLKAFITGLFSRKALSMFATGEGLLTQEDKVTEDGLQEVFETNVFGHFILIRELEPLLCHSDSPSQLIWTSSSNARRSTFSLADYQHSQGQESYSSSKYATDLLSVALNTRFNKQGMYSSVVCPGLVMTKLTYGILPAFIWMLIMPIMWLIRVFTNSFTISPYNGAEALLWLFRQRPESLDSRVKYHSCTSGLGNNYVQPVKVGLKLSGVSRESVLGPLLFNLFINELEVGIESKISIFADDTKLCKVIESEQDVISLQKDMDRLELGQMDLDEGSSNLFYQKLLELEKQVRQTIIPGRH